MRCCKDIKVFLNWPLVCKLWKLEMQRGKSMSMATERAATRSGMARSINSSAFCTLSFDGDIAFFAVVDPSSRW